MISWLKWFFWESRVCKHGDLQSQFAAAGMRKLICCGKCGKVMEIV